jgi:hypothetical protein
VQTSATDLGTLVDSGIIAVYSGATLTVSGTTTIGSGAILKVAGGGTVSVGAGAMLETLSGGTASLSGTTNNSGMLFASGAHSLVDIVSGAVVSGGVEIGNGIVDVESGGSANVTFVSGSGGLLLGDSLSNPTAFSGSVSGFGGTNHTNHGQSIALTSVKFSAGETATYSSITASSGMLTVSSGGHVVAKIAFVGAYVTSNFHLGSGSGGIVSITDPSQVVAGGAQQNFAPLVQAIANFGGNGNGPVANTLLGSANLAATAEFLAAQPSHH